MSKTSCKLLIVEGEDQEIRILDYVKRIFFPKKNFQFITLSAKGNIYMLWKLMQKDDFETDIVEILKENDLDNGKLKEITRKDVDEIFLFFDYDIQQNNLSKDLDKTSDEIILDMLKTYSDETDLGKLYISYPMIEATRDWQEESCKVFTKCFYPISDIGDYKNVSGELNPKTNIQQYGIDEWKMVIQNYSMRIACLLNLENVPSYEDYKRNITSIKIFNEELKLIQNTNSLFVLSGIPAFILDYFDKSFWRSFIKRKELKRNICNQKI